MAVATTMRRGADNRGYQSTMNIYPLSSTGIAVGGILTLSGDLGVTVLHALPNGGWKTEVTNTPRGASRLRVRLGDAVTG